MVFAKQPTPHELVGQKGRLRLQTSAFLLILVLTCVSLLWAAEPVQNGAFVDDATKAKITAVSTVVTRDPVGTAGILLYASRTEIWESASTTPTKDGFTPARTSLIDRDVLAGVEDKAPVRSAGQNYDEAQAYTYLLVEAHKLPMATLAKHARRDLTFAHLFEEPHKYRGELVHIEGRLLRLRRFDAPGLAAQQGVSHLYEGWVFGDGYFSNPYCVIVSDIPTWLQLGDKIDYPVAFDGFFFKRYRYRAADAVREAPLLIGRTFTARQSIVAASESSESFSSLLLPAFLTLLCGTVFLVLGLNWWFRRGDKRVCSQLAVTRENQFVDPSENGEEPRR